MAGAAVDAGGGGAVAGGVASARSGAPRTTTKTRGSTDSWTSAWARSRARRVPVDEGGCGTEALYCERYEGWNVKHFYSFYRRRHAGTRSDLWVKNTLPRAGLMAKAPGRGKHR